MATLDRKVLLIGGGGYVGSAIAVTLNSLGYGVRILDNFIYDHSELLIGLNADIIHGDMNDISVVNDCLHNITDVVILGGLVGNQVIEKNPILAKKTNYNGVSQIINSLDGRGLNNVIFVSTCSNYGIVDTSEYATEESVLNPLGEYAKAKVLAEKLLLSKKGKVDYTGTVLRFATAFGVSYRTRMDLLINEIIYKSLNNEPIRVYDQNTWRPYCHVNDFGDLIDKVLSVSKSDVYFETFNVGSDYNNYTKQNVIDEVSRFGYNPQVIYDKVNSDPRDYKVSFKKAEKILGFEAQYELSDGIKELINYFSDQHQIDRRLSNNHYL